MNVFFTKSLIDSSIYLYMEYFNGSISTVFRKYQEDYKTRQILFNDSFAEYLIENNYIIAINIEFDKFNKRESKYIFKLTRAALLQLL